MEIKKSLDTPIVLFYFHEHGFMPQQKYSRRRSIQRPLRLRLWHLQFAILLIHIRDFASSPQWLYQWQLEWHVIISTEFYPIKPKFLWKICRDSLSVNTSQQIARSQKDYSSRAWGKIQCKFSRVSVTVTGKVTAVSLQSP